MGTETRFEAIITILVRREIPFIQNKDFTFFDAVIQGYHSCHFVRLFFFNQMILILKKERKE
jgi:hypothetical protein